MVITSVAVAGIIGAGVVAVGSISSFASPPTSIQTAQVDSDLASALSAAFDSSASDVEPAAAPTLRANVLPVNNLDTSELTSAFAMAMNDAMNETADMAPIAPQANAPSVWASALVPNLGAENRLGAVETTVNALNEVLPSFEEAVVAIRPGDTMMNLLTDLGIDRTEAYYAIEAFGQVFNPRRIRAGQEFNVAYEILPPLEEGSANDRLRLTNISMRTAPDREVVVLWDDENEDYVGEARDILLEERFTRGRNTIDSSLYLAANDIGVPDAVTIDMIRIFSHSIDFQRDIREGDSFDVYYSRRYDEDGEPVANGNIEFASMVTRGRERNLYRFTTPDDGDTDYYDQDGKSVRAFLMRTPIDGARITSNFGNRRHPVLGYNRMHKGVDFGAPTGTPIYAAGNGTVERASRFGSYGNYVRIRHANGYETAYAHMNGYGPGIRSGVHVEQGQIIGYVGATGRVTGAHLHYEVLFEGDQVNPRTIDLPSGRELDGDMLAAFQEHRARIDGQVALAPVLEVTATASAGGGANDTPHPDLAPE